MPPELAGLESNGEISSDRSGWRQWLFGDPRTRLTVTSFVATHRRSVRLEG